MKKQQCYQKLTDKKVTRQRRWQIAKRSEGKCVDCGSEAELSNRIGVTFCSRCPRHMKAERERARKRLKCKRRNMKASSYNFSI